MLLIFCISASSNYLINEFLDRGTDKFHPIKKLRTFVKEKKNENKEILIEYFFLVSFSVVASYFINKSFTLNLIFIFGIFYNVKLIRIKDILLDVILESANNPLRFLMGWSVLMPNFFPPISIVLFFWLSGCFLMTMKRYSEYSYLVNILSLKNIDFHLRNIIKKFI